MINNKDYVLAQAKGDSKPFLMQVLQVEADGTLVGVLEHNRRAKPRQIEVRKKDVVLTLGPNPRPGKVYDVDLSNLFKKTVDHDWWGPIHFYTKLDSATLSMFRNSLDRTAKILDKHKLSPFTEFFETEVRTKKGKYAGMYHHKPKEKSLVWLAPEWAQLDSPTMDYILLHEFGHVVRYNGLKGSLKLRQKWSRLHHDSITPVVIPAKACTYLWTELLNQASLDADCSLTEALKNVASEAEKNERALKVVLKWVKQVHRASTKELSLAWDAGDTEFLRSVWPSTSIDSSNVTPVVSEYSTKNMEELFAECFAFYMTKKELPEAYYELLEKSLSYAKSTAGSDVNA